MSKPGPLNLITDVPGLAVGNAADGSARTGVTVILPERPAVGAVDVRGGAPGTRETDLLRPDCMVSEIDGIALAGGSVFGLAAGDGVVEWLRQRGRGFEIFGHRMPLVPGAIIFDFLIGGVRDWPDGAPYRELAQVACEAADARFDLGNAGAGTGACAGPLKGGLGSASAVSDDGLVVGALAVANPVGSAVMPESGAFWAWALEQAGELGHQKPPAKAPTGGMEWRPTGAIGGNTTLGVIATNLELDKSGASRIAMMAHDGLARALSPAHTPFDGDTVFVLSTGGWRAAGAEPQTLARAGALAADCLARAIARGVFEATALGDLPGYRQQFPGAFGGG